MSDTHHGITHYLLAAVVLALYGGVVCPFIADLTLTQLMTPIAVALALGFALRMTLRANVLGDVTDPNRSNQVLRIEFTSLVTAGVLYASFNDLVLDFPIGSAIKVMVGIVSIAAFAALESALRQELKTCEYCQANGIQITQSNSNRSFTSLMFLVAVAPVVIVTAVQTLAVQNEFWYLSKLATVAEVADSRHGALFESVFIAVVVIAYLVSVARRGTQLLRFHLDNQRATLRRVSEGHMQERVAVVSNDEFSSIARYTNAMLQSLETKNKAIKRTQEATILSLATLAETRDNETGSHIKRTQQYVRILAEHLAKNSTYAPYLSTAAIELIYKAAPLHDIGKVGIPDSVLLKPGKLTSSEYDTMKTHTSLGLRALEVVEESLGKQPFISCAKELVGSHHERWDGKGYPQGLAGTAIPLAGRLMAVADVYDALISKRVYKSAYSHQKAYDIIVADSGKHFDPLVVDAFIECESEFREIAQWHDEAQDDDRLAA